MEDVVTQVKTYNHCAQCFLLKSFLCPVDEVELQDLSRLSFTFFKDLSG